MRHTRDHDRIARLIGVVALVVGAGWLNAGVQAQQSSDVVLLVPEEVRAEWTAALQVELAPRGARVVPAEPPEGATVLLRDAEAQRIAIERGAVAAARVEVGESGWTLRVIGSDAAEARATPVAGEVDARTVALILASLLDDPADPMRAAVPPPPPPQPPPPPAPPPPTVRVEEASTELDDPTEETPPRADSDAAPEEESSGVEWSGRIGTGGFGLFNDRRFIGGGMIRGGLGLRVRRFEAALLAEAGVMLDTLPNSGSELQPLGRFCLELGPAFPFGDTLALHFGARGCLGIAQLRVIVFSDPFSGFEELVDELGGLASAGGYLGLSFGLTRSSRLYVRADVEGAYLESSMHRGEVLSILSVIVSFH